MKKTGFCLTFSAHALQTWHALLLITLSALSTSAHAYVPPSQFILKTWIAKKEDLKALKIKNKISAPSAGSPNLPGTPKTSEAPHLQEALWIDFQKRTLKSLIQDEADKELWATEHAFSGYPQSLSLPSLLLFETLVDSLSKSLWEAGIPIRTESELLLLPTEEERRKAEVSWISRWKNKIAWIMGAKTPAPPLPPILSPQIWIEKDQFNPLRLIVKHEGEWVETRFENVRFFKEWPYPQTISLFKTAADALALSPKEAANLTPLLQCELLELVINPDPKDAFASKPLVQQGELEAFRQSSSTTQALVQNYVQWMRR